nr:unnamed protein product [Digitaria exilis]
MCDLVARTGRHLQRYEDGRRLVAGCIPFRYRDIKDEQKKLVEVLMINSQSGPGLLFPKVWEDGKMMKPLKRQLHEKQLKKLEFEET